MGGFTTGKSSGGALDGPPMAWVIEVAGTAILNANTSTSTMTSIRFIAFTSSMYVPFHYIVFLLFFVKHADG
jgi:hypothetical protein